MADWDYNCPKYVDFTNLTQDEKDDEFFDVHNDFQDDVQHSPSKTPSIRVTVSEVSDGHNDGAGPSKSSCTSMRVNAEATGFKVQQTQNVFDQLIAGMASGAKRRSQKYTSPYALRRTPARRKIAQVAAALGGTPTAKKPRTSVSPSNGMAPLILNKSARKLRRETVDRSFSVPRASPKVPEGRKRHASETIQTKQDTPSKTKKVTVTRVQPFRFATEKRVHSQEKSKRKREEAKPYVGLAEQVFAFENQVPDRFRSVPQTRSTSAAQNNSLKLTRAITPRLRTTMRSRPNNVVSQLQKEEEELKELQKFRAFKATPFDPAIFVHTIGIPMVKSKLPTRPVEVNLATDKRSGAWKKPESEEVFHFKARPVPKKVLVGPMIAKPPTAVPVTQPKSPVFALKLRHTAWKKHEEELAAKELEEGEKTALRKTRAGTMPPAHQSPFEKRPTVPVPFSFDSTDKKRWARKDQKIKEMAQKENVHYQFHANPMPSPSLIDVPPKPKVTTTQPEPFQLLIDERGQKMADQWQNKLEAEMRQAKDAKVFKAKPSTVLLKEPFVPEKAAKPLTECTNLRLNTEKRAEERDQYEERKREMESELEELRAQKAAEEERQQRVQIRRLRAEATHKAQPVPLYHPPQIRPSDKPLTKPQSPRFSTRLSSKK